MIKSKHKWSGAAALAFAAALPAMASAQEVPDPHVGHHPSEVSAPVAPPVTPAPVAPTTPTAKPDGMMGGAQGIGCGPRMMNDMVAGHGNMPMMGMKGGDIEGRIACLQTELKITGAQTAAWNAFAGVLRANARRAGQVHMAMMAGSNGAPPSLPQRLELRERMLAVGLDNLRALKPALVRLYVELSPEQKATADRLLTHETGMMPGKPGGMGKQ